MSMLEKFDKDKIHAALQNYQEFCPSLYCESKNEIKIELHGREQKTKNITEEGSSLEYVKEGIRYTLANQEKTGATPPLSDIVKLKKRMEEWVRKSGIDLDSEPAPKITYVEQYKNVLRAKLDQPFQERTEISAQIEVEYTLLNKSFRTLRISHSPEQLWTRLESDSNFLIQPRFKGWENPWPVPMGTLPLLWSEESVAKLLLPFSKIFDEERAEKAESFFDRMHLLDPLKFDLLEESPGHTTSLLKGGTATGNLFRRNSSSHWRRNSYLANETTGPWRIEMHSSYVKEALLPELNLGVYIQDLELESFDPKSLNATLCLTKACLLHHGEWGEAILPATLNTNLYELFKSWKMFSKATKAFGYWNSKQGSRFITEIKAPQAFSTDFALPGTVPPSHYW